MEKFLFLVSILTYVDFMIALFTLTCFIIAIFKLKKGHEVPVTAEDPLIQVLEDKKWIVFHKDVHGTAIGVVKSNRNSYLAQSFLPDAMDKYFDSFEEAEKWVVEKWGTQIQRIQKKSEQMAMKTLAKECMEASQ